MRAPNGFPSFGPLRIVTWVERTGQIHRYLCQEDGSWQLYCDLVVWRDMDKQQDWTCVDLRRVLEEEQHCSYGEDMSSDRFCWKIRRRGL